MTEYLKQTSSFRFLHLGLTRLICTTPRGRLRMRMEMSFDIEDSWMMRKARTSAGGRMMYFS